MAKFSTSERNETGKHGHNAQKRAHTHTAHSKQGQIRLRNKCAMWREKKTAILKSQHTTPWDTSKKKKNDICQELMLNS